MSFERFAADFERPPVVATYSQSLGAPYVVTDEPEYTVTTSGLDYGVMWWCPRGHRNWWTRSWRPSRRHPDPPSMEFGPRLCGAPECRAERQFLHRKLRRRQTRKRNRTRR